MTVVSSETPLQFYQNETTKNQSEHAGLDSLRQQGLANFSRFGFPTRQDEDWRYSPLADFLKVHFRSVQQNSAHHDQVLLSKQTDVPWGHKLIFVDGVLIGLEQVRKVLPPGVIVAPILEALRTVPEKITPYLDKILSAQHGFHAQNSAMLELGLFIYVPPQLCLADPILIVHWQTQAEQAVYLRHVIVVDEGANLAVIEDYQGTADQTYYTNTVTEIWAAPRANLKHYKVQREGNAAWHVGHLAAKLMSDSQVDSHVLSLGGLWSRFDACFSLCEPQTRCFLNGIYAPNGEQHMDHHTWVYHQAPCGTSQQDYKGIIKDAAHAVFNGQVHVLPLAQKTVAHQQNKNLLLSNQAEIDTKPQLDIAADDVQCTHGATVGQLDSEALFYFATRGIGVQEATEYLIQGFVAENLQAIGHDTFAAWLKSKIV